MIEQLNKQLIEIKEILRTKNRLENLLCSARENLTREKDRLKNLGAKLKKEETDVRKLEGLSLTGLFHHVLGTKDQQLNREKQEFLATKLKYDQGKHSVSALEREITYREKQINDLGDPEAQYRSILEQKEKHIPKNKVKGLIMFSEKQADLNSEVKEIKEAVDAGNSVLNELQNVISYFKSAGNWGVVDLIGGGLIITAIKHSKIDKARAAVHEVQDLLGRFQRELSDLQISPESQLGIDVSSFQTFADYIFDGLIFDWIVQSKINKSLNNAYAMEDNMQNIVDNLQSHLKLKIQQRQDSEKEKTLWLEKYKD
ncbi:MAG: hypothetical protein MUP98_19885 [Candidatus Aminicenantes bacterium]|nr:hypothetical protein [Candidatus Aminicenantes bacterium]